MVNNSIADPIEEAVKFSVSKRKIENHQNFNAVIKFSYKQEFSLGGGIDLDGKVYASGLEAGTASIMLPNSGDVKQDCIISRVSENESSKISIDGKLKVALTMVEAEGSGSYSKNKIKSENRVDLYLWCEYESGKKEALKTLNYLLLQKKSFKIRGLKEFFKLYGTHYIACYISAASFLGRISIYAKSLDESEEIAGNLKVKVKSIVSVEGQASFESSEWKKENSGDIICSIDVRGATLLQDAMNEKNLIDYYKSFIKSSKSEENRDSSSRPYLVLCNPWTQVQDFMEICNEFKYDSYFTQIEHDVILWEEIKSCFSVCNYSVPAKLLLASQSFLKMHDFLMNYLQSEGREAIRNLEKFADQFLVYETQRAVALSKLVIGIVKDFKNEEIEKTSDLKAERESLEDTIKDYKPEERLTQIRDNLDKFRKDANENIMNEVEKAIYDDARIKDLCKLSVYIDGYDLYEYNYIIAKYPILRDVINKSRITKYESILLTCNSDLYALLLTEVKEIENIINNIKKFDKELKNKMNELKSSSRIK